MPSVATDDIAGIGVILRREGDDESFSDRCDWQRRIANSCRTCTAGSPSYSDRATPRASAALDGVVAMGCDLNRVDDLAPILREHDVVVSSVHFLDGHAELLIDAVRRAGVPRYVVVGGAGSLDNCKGVRLIDAGDVPEPYQAESRAGCAFLDLLRRASDLDWAFLSPSAQFVAGERTGVFRLGADTALRDENGRSWISYEDYAVALVDEIEQPRHSRCRFTVGY
jgi:putative NADH-flavin reductase